jgi:hypothetical protein
MFMVFLKARGRASGSQFEDAFFMLIAFSFSKGTAIAIDLVFVNGLLMSQGVILRSLSDMLSVVANVFFFQAAVDFLIFRLPTKLKFRIMPVFIFSGYLLLYVSGIIDVEDVEKIGRVSFGYNSAILNGIAMFNLYYIMGRRHRGLILAGLSFILYAIFEGIIHVPVYGIDIRIVRMFCALILFVSSFPIVNMLSERKAKDKIGYV